MIETELLMEELEDESNLLEGMDLLEMYRNMSMDGGFYPCIICIITSLFVCADFQSGFIKNIMSSHRNRWRYVVSKLLTMGIVNFFFTMISFGFCFLTNALFHMVPFTNWLDVLFYLGWACYYHSVFLFDYRNLYLHPQWGHKYFSSDNLQQRPSGNRPLRSLKPVPFRPVGNLYALL